MNMPPEKEAAILNALAGITLALIFLVLLGMLGTTP